MADAMYPANGVARKILPNCSGFIVTKFDPVNKYREEEEVTNESGILSNILGIDLMDDVEADLIPKPNTSVPNIFDVLNFSGGTIGNGSYLVRGDVSIIGTAGGSKKISLRLMKNAEIP